MESCWLLMLLAGLVSWATMVLGVVVLAPPMELAALWLALAGRLVSSAGAGLELGLLLAALAGLLGERWVLVALVVA